MRTINQDREEVWPLGYMKPKSDTLAGAELLKSQQYDSCTVSICHLVFLFFCFVTCLLSSIIRKAAGWSSWFQGQKRNENLCSPIEDVPE